MKILHKEGSVQQRVMIQRTRHLLQHVRYSLNKQTDHMKTKKTLICPCGVGVESSPNVNKLCVFLCVCLFIYV